MKKITIKQGLNIPISGKAQTSLSSMTQSEIVAIAPDDFAGVVPKLAIKIGDRVSAGSLLFSDKANSQIKFTSPVSGVIEDIARGERRKLLYIAIRRDLTTVYEEFTKVELQKASREEICEAIFNSGLGMFIKQRPYNVVANPSLSPKAIFVSGFDTAPLAPDYNYIVKGQGANLQAGLTALSKLTDGKVYLSVQKGAASELTGAQNVEIVEVEGIHPAGNVGTQINRISPINKDEIVWTVALQDVIMIGRFFNTQKVDMTKFVALTGPEVHNPCYYKTVVGTAIEPITTSNVSTGEKLRYISGNVLSGTQIDANGYLKPFDSQITVVKEGDNNHEFVGWAMPRFNLFSSSNLFFNKLFDNPVVNSIFGKPKYDFDTRLLGGERAFIVSGEYEKVFPMDIYPEQLIKAMIAKNLDKMEALGAYEVVPEDFALCEYVCTSKIECQHIVAEALEYMKTELE